MPAGDGSSSGVGFGTIDQASHSSFESVGVGLPRGVVYAFALTPIVAQPITNADLFREGALAVGLEVLGNYVPSVAILAGLWLFYRVLAASPATLTRWRHAETLAKVGGAMLVAGIVSAAVLPLHRSLVTNLDVPLAVYLQRNVGLTCLIVLPVSWLEEHRRRARAAERQLLEQQKHALRAELEVLRSRTQPHFLFNVLNTIASLIRDDADLAERTVERLARILRHALECSRRESVALAEELAVIEEYLEVQRARFGDKLRWEIALERGAEQAAIPPFILQPLVENAVVHAVAGRARGGRIWIRAARRGRRVELAVDDDGPGPGGSTHRGTGTSLSDLAQRLRLAYGSDATLASRSNERGGFTVELAFESRE